MAKGSLAISGPNYDWKLIYLYLTQYNFINIAIISIIPSIPLAINVLSQLAIRSISQIIES
ncbi:hypothetical protein SVI_0002 [Shewanella violacea DSS12]|uniref:Uncharacterized protein n=1 Tax=Shewanella violacea (strain JCM 10179 / CIP 106290 / LMG 19151 / DSS12) TaxID=637905 RepID=D4ZD51_SHEVD|nr:hypothetical protein SVI_0002 [Shewanella violacea DSS12]